MPEYFHLSQIFMDGKPSCRNGLDHCDIICVTVFSFVLKFEVDCFGKECFKLLDAAAASKSFIGVSYRFDTFCAVCSL